MQNEFDSPDESEWDEEEPYYDWDDPDWREDWDDEAAGNMGDANQGDMRLHEALSPRGGHLSLPASTACQLT